MSYNNYEEWRYSKWLKNIEDTFSAQNKQQQFGLKQWIEKLDNEKIKNDLKRLSEMRYDGRSGNLYEDIILTAWAQAFSPDCYDAKNDVVIKGNRGNETFFNVSRKFGRILRLYFNGTASMPLSIPSCNGEDNSEPYYWIVIASALQKRYSLFNNLDDLNKFIFAVNNEEKFGELQNYGLYVRNINELCLAYAILRGYSLSEEINLLKYADKIIKYEQKNISFEKKAAENTYTYTAMKSFENFLIKPSLLDHNDDESFLSFVKKNAKVFIQMNGSRHQQIHWSSLKQFLSIRHQIQQDPNVERNFESRIQSIINLYKNLVGDDFCFELIPKSGLLGFLSKCLAINEVWYYIGLYHELEEYQEHLNFKKTEIQRQIRSFSKMIQEKAACKEYYELHIGIIIRQLDDKENEIENERDESKRKELEKQNEELAKKLKMWSDDYDEYYRNPIHEKKMRIKTTEEGVWGIKKTTKSINQTKKSIENLISDLIKNHLRYIYIVFIMKSIQEKTESAGAALELINNNLREAGFREIEDYERDGIDNITAKEQPDDWFDWFVVQTIIFEEMQDDGYVSGYTTFMNYVFPEQ